MNLVLKHLTYAMEFQLRERTILISGPFSSTIQSFIHVFTQMGADVVLLDKDASKSQRFCSQISDSREVNPKFGRAASVAADFSTEEKVKNSLGDAARIFGSIDIYIDAWVSNEKSNFEIGVAPAGLQNLIDENLQRSIWLTTHVLSYLKARKRGRLIYLMNENQWKNNIFSQQDLCAMAVRSGIVTFSKTLAKQVLEFNITVNCLSLGLSEEWLLGHFPGKTIKEALSEVKNIDSTLRISEPERVAQAAMYLLTNMGAGITGQVIEVL